MATPNVPHLLLGVSCGRRHVRHVRSFNRYNRPQAIVAEGLPNQDRRGVAASLVSTISDSGPSQRTGYKRIGWPLIVTKRAHTVAVASLHCSLTLAT